MTCLANYYPYACSYIQYLGKLQISQDPIPTTLFYDLPISKPTEGLATQTQVSLYHINRSLLDIFNAYISEILNPVIVALSNTEAPQM